MKKYPCGVSPQIVLMAQQFGTEVPREEEQECDWERVAEAISGVFAECRHRVGLGMDPSQIGYDEARAKRLVQSAKHGVQSLSGADSASWLELWCCA